MISLQIANENANISHVSKEKDMPKNIERKQN